MQLQEAFDSRDPEGAQTRLDLGEGPAQVNFLPWSCIWKPLGQDCMGQLTVGVRGCGGVGPWAERVGRAKLWEGGPVAASRAPASSLPGSIRDQTPSNAAQ